MAVRLFSKINSTFNSNLIQVFRPRSLVKSAAVSNVSNDKVEQTAPKKEEDDKIQLPETNIQSKTYDVRERSTLSFPDLQPSTLQDYYSPYQNFENSSSSIEKPVVEPNKSASQRIFEVSTTYKNVKLPLKMPRLAKPFPDPVKTMASDTISDDEKARQMQSDARYPGNSNSKNSNKINFNPQYRSFATKSRKCKAKSKKSKKPKCDKTRYKNCPKVRLGCACSFDFKPCKKQKAPYASYSELCPTVLDSNPTECRMCPWSPQNHPTFKTKKRKYHTAAITFSPKKRDFERWLHDVDQNRGWVQEKKTLKKCEKNQDKTKLVEINKNIETPISTNQLKLYHTKKYSIKSKNKKSSDPITIQKLPSALNDSRGPYVLCTGTKLGDDEIIETKSFKKNGKRRNKSEMLPIVKYNSKTKNTQSVVHNPSKKEKQFDQDWKKEETPSTINITINYFMAKKKDRNLPPGTRDKCPDADPVDDDPCKLKRKGKTRECPKDLLIKKRRPLKPKGKKKCYPINPSKPSNPDQPEF